MTVKEMRTKTNAELILYLCSMMSSYKYFKGNVKESLKVYKELERRDVIKNAEEAHKKWVKRYEV